MQKSWPLAALTPDAETRAPGFLDALARRAADGDADAFEQIYNLLADELYAFIRGQCHNETVAEDIMANVFLKAWRSIGRYNAGSDRFRRWIFAIARNEVRDHWRSTQRTLPFLDIDIGEETDAPDGADPEEARRQVAKAMSILTEEQRQVVVLRYFSNKSHEEIAAIMGKREGAVRALLLRALRRMRKAMADGELSAQMA
ncbi:MAG TPA: RNA polymerase sigma factor [Tepidiformaceae bacterium]|nr:RNA polymerase sigma factor [Tepidiformaceae bacterium]